MKEEEAAIESTPFSLRAEKYRSLAERERSLRTAEDALLDAESRRLHAILRARYLNWPSERLLLVASVLITGPSARAVAVESFLDQKYEPFGYHVTVAPRLGIESEPVQERLRARVGTYVEPSRVSTSDPRQHFTAGLELKLAAFDFWGVLGDTIWGVRLAGDVAPRYFNWGFGLGAWH